MPTTDPTTSDLTTTVDVNGTTLHYERTGQGPAMLFVHGLCGDAEAFAEQERRLSDRYTCVRYDRRGHTRSDRGDAPMSATLHADDVAALIEALDLAPCLLVASSMGAAIATDVARRHGHLLRGAVLSEPPLFQIDPDAWRDAIGELNAHLEQAGVEPGSPAAVDVFFSYICPGLWAILDEDGRNRYRANADIGFTDLRSPSADVTIDDLADVDVPVLVLGGEQSHPAHRSVTRQMAAALPDARFVEFVDCGHVTYAEQPDAFTDAVAVFAAELDRRTATTRTGGVA